MIPLNKVSPAIPKSTQIRFIVAISPVQKLLEAVITPFLMSYAIENLSDKQRGFIAEMTTHHNITDILNPDNKGKEILLIDFASAFDTIDRRKLYDVLVSRDILPPAITNLLLFIHTNSLIKLGAHTIQTRKGVPQGSLISPLLFNIYIAELLDLMSSFGLTKAFADDIGIALNKDRNTEDAIDVVVNWTNQNSMQLNRSKSGILSKRKPAGQNIKGIPVCAKYKYLGVVIDSNLNTGPHINYLRQTLYKRCLRIMHLSKSNTLQQRMILLKTLILPIANYAKPGTDAAKYRNHNEQLAAVRRKCTRLVLSLGQNTKNVLVNAIISSNLKNLTPEIIHLINTFNRSKCKLHRKRLSTTHLKQNHFINISYTDIEKAIIEGKNQKICHMLKLILTISV